MLQQPPEIEKNKEGQPLRPPSAYMLFARDVRKILKKKMPNCTLSDIMKAVSMDWVKLHKSKKAEYYREAKRKKHQFNIELNEWTTK